eukprot:403348038
MQSKKKQWAKAIDQTELLRDIENHNTQKAMTQKLTTMKDEDLFTVNAKKQNVKGEREKLKRDRFKEKEKIYTSKTEQDLLKRFILKQERNQSTGQHVQKKKSESEDEDLDIWNSSSTTASIPRKITTTFTSVPARIEIPKQKGKNFGKFQEYKKKKDIKVKAVVVPLGGQSYNPSAKDHKEVIQKVIAQEFEEVKEVERRMRHLQPYLFEKENASVAAKKAAKQKTIDDASDDDEPEHDSDNENGLERTNKAVDRLNKLTKTEKNARLIKQLKQKEQQRLRKVKQHEKSFEKLPMFIQQDENIKRRMVNNVKRRTREADQEKQVQEKVGIVNRAAKLGKYNYKMKKIDFQTEEELAGNLRQLKPRGPADLLVDRYDSIFRRRMLEPDEPLNSDRKRIKKAKYKWHQSQGGKMADKMARKNEERKQKNNKKGMSSDQMLQNDLILI